MHLYALYSSVTTVLNEMFRGRPECLGIKGVPSAGQYGQVAVPAPGSSASFKTWEGLNMTIEFDNKLL